jgi:hypothetical protein
MALSDLLFAPDGLFSQLAETEDERRRLAQTALFQQAQSRLTELQREEAEKFARAVKQIQASLQEEQLMAVRARA